MIDVLVNTDYVLKVELSETSEGMLELSNTHDEVYYTILDTTGNVVNDLSNVKVEIDPTNPSVINIPLSKEINVIDEDKPFNLRFVEIVYLTNNQPTRLRRVYRVVKFAPYTTSLSDVRHLFGVDSSVLLDDMIDIYAAYISEKSVITNLDELLIDFGPNSIKANRLIALRAAIALESSLPLIVPRIETDSVVSQTRFTLTLDDFKKILGDLKEELTGLEEELVSDGVYTPSISFAIGDITDIFTGE